ncbi:hypothetical protein E2C01_035262 [Portunus trituberculatus]|uniref:Uncharacterized protein n=1 Tax=Portunus trituberculatus TaxID=210409 RepID=A0A5B7F593_PORTR|nr:hypothetical protein [Portunus trituberculatus]
MRRVLQSWISCAGVEEASCEIPFERAPLTTAPPGQVLTGIDFVIFSFTVAECDRNSIRKKLL